MATNNSINNPYPPSLKITYTGSLAYPLLLTMSPGNVTLPIGAASGQQTYTANAGPATNYACGYSEGGFTVGNRLLTISFDDLVSAGSTLDFSNCSAITSISFPELISMFGGFACGTFPLLTTLNVPKLTYIGGSLSTATLASLTTLSFPELLGIGASGNFTPTTMALLTTFNFPKLISINGSFTPTIMAALTTLSVPELVNVGYNFAPTTMANLTTFTFAKLAYIQGTFAPTTMASLATISINSLQTIVGAASVASMASLTTVSLAGMITYGSTITMNSGLGKLASVVLGTIGTLKSVAGNINLSGQKLNLTSVDRILALIASLDGTGGTTSWGTGRTLTLNGGTNAIPDAAGLASKLIITNRRATVLVNS